MFEESRASTLKVWPWLTWETETDYPLGSRVWVYGQEFECIVPHTSDIFGNDLFDEKYWKPLGKPNR
jgi:hypothetical protein